MPRNARSHLQRGFFHVLNRGNHRQALFPGDEDYALFLELLTEAQKRFAVSLWGYCLMGNHWYLVVEVEKMDELSRWIHWLCTRQARLFHLERRGLGGGHIYQGRYKSFPIQDEVYLHQVLRYVEANPVRARLAANGRDWPWSSLSSIDIKKGLLPVERPKLKPWPRDASWEADVDRPIAVESLLRLQQSVTRGTPLGEPEWVERIAMEQGLKSTIRPPGRPKKSLTTI